MRRAHAPANCPTRRGRGSGRRATMNLSLTERPVIDAGGHGKRAMRGQLALAGLQRRGDQGRSAARSRTPKRRHWRWSALEQSMIKFGHIRLAQATGRRPLPWESRYGPQEALVHHPEIGLTTEVAAVTKVAAQAPSGVSGRRALFMRNCGSQVRHNSAGLSERRLTGKGTGCPRSPWWTMTAIFSLRSR